MKRALVVNAYSTGNWGDTAIVEGLIGSLRSAGYDEVTVAPVDWRSGASAWRTLGADGVVPPLLSVTDVHPLLRRPKVLRLASDLPRLAIHRVAPRFADESMRAYRGADIVVSAGGAYLGGRRAGGNFLKLANIRAGRRAGKRTVVAPVTVNPFSPTVRTLLRWGLDDAATFVREVPSRDRLEAAGIPATLGMDLAFAAPTLRAIATSPASAPGTGSGRIGWAPRSYRADHDDWGRPKIAEATTLRAVRSMLATSSDRVTLFAHVQAGDRDDDGTAVRRLLDGFSPDERDRVDVAPTPTTLRQSVERYAFVDVLITSRMHAAIFAMASGTPAVAVNYEPKVDGVMSLLGLADRVVPADARLAAPDLASLVARLRTPAERTVTRDAFARAGEAVGEFQARLA